MDFLGFTIGVLFRISIFAIAFAIAYFLIDRDNAIFVAIGIYLAFRILIYITYIFHRLTHSNIESIELGSEIPRFSSVEGVIRQLEYIVAKREENDENFDTNSPKIPLRIDLEMDDAIDSLSRFTKGQREEFFAYLSSTITLEIDRAIEEPAYEVSLAFRAYIMRAASRAVRDKEPSHLVRGLYAAQAALVGSADYRDVLVALSTIWDAARRIRVLLEPAAELIANETPNIRNFLEGPPAGLKAMGITTVEDEYGFRYEYDETW